VMKSSSATNATSTTTKPVALRCSVASPIIQWSIRIPAKCRWRRLRVPFVIAKIHMRP
jgi:hypothetical protein